MSRDQNKFTLLKLVVVVVGSARIVRKFVDDILGAPPETNTIFEIHLFERDECVSNSVLYINVHKVA